MKPKAARRALDHDLHTEVGHVPAAVLDDVVEQHPQVGVDLELAAELLVDVPVEDLDVAGLVDHLRRRVQLGVVPRHGLDDLGGAEQGALFAVEELRQRPAALVDAELEPLLVAPLLDDGALVVVGGEAGRRCGLVGADDLLDVDVGVPVEVGRAVPLTGLGLLVQLAELGPGEGVVPREDGVGVVLDDVFDLVHVGVRDRQDRLDVVDVGAADDLFVGGEGVGHVRVLSEVRGVSRARPGRRNARAESGSPRSTCSLGARK
ncbi:MAG: hypothetical protein R2697_21680 [Ilumatobacteraceae bacterium]